MLKIGESLQKKIPMKNIGLGETFIKKSIENFDFQDTLFSKIVPNFFSALFIILVGLKMTGFSEKMLVSIRFIHGFMSNLIKKSWTYSKGDSLERNTGRCKKNFLNIMKQTLLYGRLT